MKGVHGSKLWAALAICILLTGCGSASWHLATKPTAEKTQDRQAVAQGTDIKNTAGDTSKGETATDDALTVRPAEIQYPTLHLGDASNAVVRLQQILARLGYLPVVWNGKDTANDAYGDELLALKNPPKGTWAWRYSDTPSALRSLWAPGQYNVMMQGAVMTFQEVHNLTIDGIAGPQFWQTLIEADMNNEKCPYPYSYVYVSKDLPEQLTLWENGQTVLHTKANTGVAAAPTPTGTWPVYLRLRSQTMTGRNPDGSVYRDPGVPYISYFYKGDAVHGFVRHDYGWPQSVGCVELPVDAAKTAWEHMHYGTLVTVAD
ncbi:L,D-transpeptidase family protein [Alicyclobacillus shizuokensis]|uniref:L,D-transpeptidase family protein n=1 Tax=Alicyclobacillus shizuokensis TaxID=392014 RepID=UPI000A911B55|nr:L,D-transpeptidase family protein [Alicyclobacillus shizuokensis]MCL6625782.1 L,D-transpeptidase family protein [Alicyclobacillus shizuokensis]